MNMYVYICYIYVCCKCDMIGCISEEEGRNKVEQGVFTDSSNVFVCRTSCFIAIGIVVGEILIFKPLI